MPGSDIFDPTKGAGLNKLIGQTPIYGEEDLRHKLMLVVMNTEQQIKSEQRLALDLPPDERLESLQLKVIETKYGNLEPIEVDFQKLTATLRPVVKTAAGHIDYFDLSLNLP